MADVSEVADALAALVQAAVYPSGTGAAPAGGVACKIYQGWPEPKQLLADLQAQHAHVSIWPSDQDRVTTRRMPEWVQAAAPAPSLAATAAGTAVTIGGTVSTPQAVALLIDGKDYAYAVQPADTLASIAAALAALVVADRAASSAGPVLTIPGSRTIYARLVTTGTSVRETRRESRVFKVIVWADAPARRTALAKVIDQALCALVRVAFADGTVGNIDYVGSQQVDSEQRQGIYRRDLSYAIEYPTLEIRTDTTVGIVQQRLTPINSAAATVTNL
ncbi:MAG: putative phage protein [Polaromonas sp.]|nr:putative phage protein [Polaromonas sp.]